MKDVLEMSPMAARVADVAEALLQQVGYNGFSYDDIARQVGIRKPSVHHHFATKADLVRAVAERYTHRFMQQLDAITHAHSSAGERLDAYTLLFERTYAQERKLCVCGMLAAEASDLPESVAEAVQAFFARNLEWLTAVIAARPGARALPRAQAHARAMSLLCTLEGAMIVGRGLRSKAGPRKAVSALIDLALMA
jgi:TetR/AcrR family transcriptional regulator, transcriptional repressor for nem operon